MIKAWLIGLGTYIIGIMSTVLRLKIEARDNPDFIPDFIDKYLANDREDSLAIGAPYFCAIFPGLNFVVGAALIAVAVNEKWWALFIRGMLDKK